MMNIWGEKEFEWTLDGLHLAHTKGYLLEDSRDGDIVQKRRIKHGSKAKEK
jgi:hypothetical protein